MKQKASAFNLERAGVIAGVIGFALLVAGVSFIYWPAGLIVGGLLLLAWSAMAARAVALANRHNNKVTG